LSTCVNFYFFNAYAFLCRASGVRVVPHGGSHYQRDASRWEANRANTKDSGHGGKGGGFGAPPGRLRGHGGRKLPLSLNPWEMVMKRKMKMRKRGRGRWFPLPTLYPLKTFPHMKTTSVGKRGSPLVRTDRNAPRWEPGHRPSHCHSPISHWYLLTYKG
jgi:hypothetical protein